MPNFQNFLDSSENISDRLNKVTESKFMNGAQVARDLGITRVAVKKNLQKAIPKIYKAVVDTMSGEATPLQSVLYMAQMLGVDDDEDGIRTIFRNLDPKQKTIIYDDIRKNYPQYSQFIKEKGI